MRPANSVPWPAQFAGAISLLWVALVNGYPLVFSDTGRYLQSAVDRFTAPIQRPLGYGWFIYFSSLNWSPWLTTIWQAAIAALVIALLVRMMSPQNTRAVYAYVLAATAFLSSAPYFTGQLMPDYFSGLLPLALYLLIAHYKQIAWLQRVGLATLVFFAVASHTSNVVIVPVTALAYVLLLLFFARKTSTPTERKAWLGGAVLSVSAAILATLAICASNLNTFHRFVISPAAHAFLLARLVADGPAAVYLRKACPQAGYRLCAEVENLPNSSDTFLYGSELLEHIGGWRGSSTESRQIIAATLADSPGRIVLNAISATARQFVCVGLDPDVFNPIPITRLTIERQIDRLYPDDSVELRSSLQQRGKLNSAAVRVHSWMITVTFWIALLTVVGFAVRSLRMHPSTSALAGMLVIFLLINALICGALSAVHERYQCRATWGLVVVAAILVARRWPSLMSTSHPPP